jgi:hypothetical protein
VIQLAGSETSHFTTGLSVLRLAAASLQLGRADEFLFSSANLELHTVMGGVGTARRLLALPPIVGSCNLGSASGWTGQGRVHGGDET